MGPGEDSPRIFLGGLERQGDAFAIHVDIEDLDGDLIANSDNLGRVVDVLPGQLGDVNQTVYATKIDECAEVDDRGNDALAYLALLELVQELGANLGLGLLKPCTTREHNVVAVLVELDDLRFQLLADVRLKITHATHFNQGCGEEPTKTDIENQAALNDLNNGAGDGLILLFKFFDGAPSALILCTLLRQDQTTFFVLFGENKSVDLIADLNNFVGVDFVLDGQLT